MSPGHRELLILGGVFVAVVWFVWTHVSADLPDDFLTRARQNVKADKESR
jgi:hypothetical protein